MWLKRLRQYLSTRSKGALLSVVATVLLLPLGPAAGQSQADIGRALDELSMAEESTAAFLKRYRDYKEALQLARTRPPSPDILDEIRLGEEIEFGNRSAPDVVVVFLDYECDHCAPSSDFIGSLETPGARNLRIVVRFPAGGNLIKDSAHALLHCIYNRSPATFLRAFTHLGSNPPGTQEDLKSFAQAAGLLSSDYEQCLGGTKAMQRILHVYQYNIELYGACLLVGCTTTLDSSGEAVSTVALPLAIFGSNPSVGSSFRIARAKSDPHWWQ